MTTAEDQPHFVWWRGATGPEPQKWGGLDYGVGFWRKPYIIAAHKITALEFQTESLATLARRFPLPEEARGAA